MTVSQILESARNNLNAVNDTFWNDSDLLIKLYEAMLQMSRRCKAIEATDSSTLSVVSQADYTAPTNWIEIVRIEYDGTKLQYISARERDELYYNVNPIPSGTPIYYTEFADTFTLVPTPNVASKVIKFTYYKAPAVPTSSSTLEIPAIAHDALVSGLTAKMCPRDVGNPLTLYWENKWANGLAEIETFFKRRKRTDRFSVVQTEEQAIRTNFGIV